MTDIGATSFLGICELIIGNADGYGADSTARGQYTFLQLTGGRDDVGLTEGFRNNTLPVPPTGGGGGDGYGATINYVMRGRDVDCGSVTYRTWVTVGSPDSTGGQYGGSKCGANPLADIVIVSTFTT